MTETMQDTVGSNPAKQQVRFQNYWGAQNVKRWLLPDGEQWIEFKTQDEGLKAQYQQRTNRDITFDKTGNTKMGIDPVTDRHTLIEMSVTNWHMFIPKSEDLSPAELADPDNWDEAAFSPKLIREWLRRGDPKVIQDLEVEIRMANPWMQSEMTVEEIDKEIARLNEVRIQAVEREAEKAGSGTR
jgi:hypothetical protein